MPYIGNIVQDFSVSTAMLNTDSVTSIKVLDGTIVNADINASAAIAGTKISPDFGSQNIATTGALDIGANAAIFGTLTISNATPTLIFTEDDANPDYKQLAAGGEFVIQNNQGGSYATRFKINADGHIDITGGLDVTSGGIDVTGAINSTVDSAHNTLKIETTTTGDPKLNFNAAGSGGHEIEYIRSSNTLNFKQGGGSVRMSIAAGGTVDIAGNLDVGAGIDCTGAITGTTNLTIGGASSIFAENNLRFKSSGDAFIDHNTTGQDIKFRVSNSSALDTTPLTLNSDGHVDVAGNLDVGAGIDVTGDVIGTGKISIDGDGGSKFFAVGDNEDFKIYHDATGPTIFSDPHNQGLKISAKNLDFTEYTGTTTRFKINDDGHVDVTGNLDVGAGIDVTGNVTTTGDITITSATPIINLTDSNNDSDYQIKNGNGDFNIKDVTNNANRLTIASDGTTTINGGVVNLGTADSSSGHLNAFEVMTFNIDSDNDDTNRYFAFYKDGASGSGTELFKIEESGAATLTGSFTASGTLTGVSTSSVPALTAKGDGSSQDGYIQLNCSQNTHGVKIKAPPHSAAASYTLTLPDTDGSANQVLKTDGSGGLSWVNQSSGSGSGLFASYARISDTKAYNVSAGASLGDDTQIRTLNTEDFDPDGIVSLSSNQFTLGAGTYFIKYRTTYMQTDRSVAFIYDVTASSAIQMSVSIGYSIDSSADDGDSLIGSCRVTISSDNVYELRHYTQTARATYGLGVAHGENSLSSLNNVYTIIEIYKES